MTRDRAARQRTGGQVEDERGSGAGGGEPGRSRTPHATRPLRFRGRLRVRDTAGRNPGGPLFAGSAHARDRARRMARRQPHSRPSGAVAARGGGARRIRAAHRPRRRDTRRRRCRRALRHARGARRRGGRPGGPPRGTARRRRASGADCDREGLAARCGDPGAAQSRFPSSDLRRCAQSIFGEEPARAARCHRAPWTDHLRGPGTARRCRARARPKSSKRSRRDIRRKPRRRRAATCARLSRSAKRWGWRLSPRPRVNSPSSAPRACRSGPCRRYADAPRSSQAGPARRRASRYA